MEYDKNWTGIDNEGIDQESLRILQEALTKSFDDLNYLMHKKKDLLHALRSQIFVRRQEYQGLAKELQERGFELMDRDAEEHGLAVEEVRLYHPEHQIVVTADYSLKEMTGIGMVTRLPEPELQDDDAGYGWESIELIAASTEQDRVKLADQLLTDAVQAVQEAEDNGGE